MIDRSERGADWSEALEEGPRVDLERLIDELEGDVLPSPNAIQFRSALVATNVVSVMPTGSTF